MSSDLTNDGPFGLLAPEDSQGLEKTGEQSNAKLLMLLRSEFQENPAVRECLSAEDREVRRHGVLHFTEKYADGHGGMEALERAVDYLLDELDRMKEEGHGQYLVDASTGKVVAPLTQDLVYQQPDFINEAGQLVKGKKVVDPGFASAVGLAKQKEHRTKLALAKAGGSMALEHLRNPDSILDVARRLLSEAGFPEPEGSTSEAVLEIGREQVDGVLQSPSAGFHRHAAYGAVLAKKIMGRYPACEIVDLSQKENSKERWYEVKVRVPAQDGASPPTLPSP